MANSSASPNVPAQNTAAHNTATEDIAPQDVPFIVFSGFCMGTADVVPGVSGGTMAVALGIYHQLLSAIASVNVRVVQALLKLNLREALSLVHVRFLIALLTGVGLGVVLMVKVVKLPQLLESSPMHVYAVFFGLVLASAVLLGKGIPWSGGRVLSFLLGVGLGFGVVNMVPVATPEAPWFIFLCGFIAICAMVLPGISGSFVLLILGKYAYILNGVGHLDFGILLPFVAGCALGITTFSRVVAWALSRYHDTVLASLVGLLIGSLWRIWPYQELTTIIVREKPRVVGATPFVPESIDPLVVGLLLVGVALVFGLEFVAGRRLRNTAVSA